MALGGEFPRQQGASVATTMMTEPEYEGAGHVPSGLSAAESVPSGSSAGKSLPSGTLRIVSCLRALEFA
ncbi:hypothetical protein DFR70_11875 [Nocardia tenerifensis]|uniref:Uncharacterized protein n=1 Tax=Nocardia tenerifensis TaxID=228006 RepID=A0A318JPN8_9NOCA|nr:hypothetical protein DFR70_11875 [Nocardia tenerifensis]